MSYPVAYCVKCKSYTETLDKHTVILNNNRRALKGVCPKCSSDNYRLLPAKTFDKLKNAYTIKGRSTEGYCMKCKSKQKVRFTEGRIFKNGRAAMYGNCETCKSDVYKIIPLKLPKKSSRTSRSKGSESGEWIQYALAIVCSIILGAIAAYWY